MPPWTSALGEPGLQVQQGSPSSSPLVRPSLSLSSAQTSGAHVFASSKPRVSDPKSVPKALLFGFPGLPPAHELWPTPAQLPVHAPGGHGTLWPLGMLSPYCCNATTARATNAAHKNAWRSMTHQ